MNAAVLDGVRLGVSACLLGQHVRFDGGHKRSDLVLRLAREGVIFEPVCLEVESGLATPQAALRLVENGNDLRVVEARRPENDHTRRLADFSADRIAKLTRLSGFIFKKDSPSCGMERVKVYAGPGLARRNGTGVFAAKVMDRFPLLPVEEEGRLNDAALYHNFIERVLAYRDWQRLRDEGMSPAKLIGFHTRHKLQLLARDETSYRRLGRMLANIGAEATGEKYLAYFAAFTTAMKKLPTPRRQANVLFHIAGYFKRRLSADEKRELTELIDAYRRERLPLIAPLLLLRHYLRAAPNRFLEQQQFLNVRLGSVFSGSDGVVKV